MKKITVKRRRRDVKLGLTHRGGRAQYQKSRINQREETRLQINQWLDKAIERGVSVTFTGSNVILNLPLRMNFSDEYELTARYMETIRRLTKNRKLTNSTYRLKNVNFDGLMEISTSAALVLTAELSKWDDTLRQKLVPQIDGWNINILEQFYDLGFFELFENNPFNKHKPESCQSNLKFVKYIKGKCGDSSKTRELKLGINDIIGKSVDKWTFLHSGLDEAITNVTHHAYPKEFNARSQDKNWYLTGSYNQNSRQLKIVFYDQGIGIPKSLPASSVWEKALAYFSSNNIVGRKNDMVLLRAAVELNRTRTDENDRGRGLQDLLEFIKQRKRGYLSILSLRGLYKYSVDEQEASIKSISFKQKINGTLIIWCVAL